MKSHWHNKKYEMVNKLVIDVDLLTYQQNILDGPSCFPDGQTCTLRRTSSLPEKLLPTYPLWPGN